MWEWWPLTFAEGNPFKQIPDLKNLMEFPRKSLWRVNISKHKTVIYIFLQLLNVNNTKKEAIEVSHQNACFYLYFCFISKIENLRRKWTNHKRRHRQISSNSDSMPPGFVSVTPPTQSVECSGSGSTWWRQDIVETVWQLLLGLLSPFVIFVVLTLVFLANIIVIVLHVRG